MKQIFFITLASIEGFVGEREKYKKKNIKASRRMTDTHIYSDSREYWKGIMRNVKELEMQF